MKVLIFQLYGDYGHFRPYYTTSSPTTYSVMPPTSIIGLIGAILGLPKENDLYYQQLADKGIRVGIGIETPVKKTTMSLNLINTKGNYWVPTRKNSNGPRTPTRYEFVKEQSYIIYVSMEDKCCLDELAFRLQNHTFAYTISLGLAGLIADARFLSYEEASYVESKDYIEVDSTIPVSSLQGADSIDITKGVQYCKERYVQSFADNRIPLKYVDVLFSTNAKRISVKCHGAYESHGRKFLFIN